MGRRNEHTRAEIKKMAIEAGRKIIEKEGYSGLGARKVARTIGYTVGTLYNVFDNQLDLTLHINTLTLDDLKEHLEGSVESKASAMESIKNLGISYQEYALANKNLWSALFEFQYPDGELPEWYLEKVNSLFSVAVKYFVTLCGEDTNMAEKHARTLWAGVHGVCSLGLSQRLGREDEDVIKVNVSALIENYIKGLTMNIKN